MKVRLEAVPNFDVIQENSMLLELVRNIKTIYHQFDHRISTFIAIDMGERKILNYYQQPHETVPIYVRNLNNAIETLEHYGGGLVPPPPLIDAIAKKHGIDVEDPIVDMEVYYEKTHEYYLEAKEQRYATCLILRSDPKRYGLLVMRLKNDYAFGKDHYPATRQQAAELLLTFTPEVQKGFTHQQALEPKQESTHHWTPIC